MLTPPEIRKRRPSRKSDLMPDRSCVLPSSPGVPIEISVVRPTVESGSTNSSTSSKKSDTFDVERHLIPRPESPLTPTCETPPHDILRPPEIRFSVHTSDEFPNSEPKHRKRLWAEDSRSQSSELEDTPSKPARRRLGTGKSRLSKDWQSDTLAFTSQLAPGDNGVRHQRSSSAPTLPSKSDRALDEKRQRMPGGWDLQTSNVDVRQFENIQTQHSGSTDLRHVARQSKLPAEQPELVVQGPDSTKEAEIYIENEDHSFQQENKNPKKPHSMSGFQDLLFPHFSRLRWLLELLQPTPLNIVPENLPAQFTPYTCEKGNPTVRKLNERVDINLKMLKLIDDTQAKPEQLGWLYVLTSKTHGHDILKTGKSGDVCERIKSLSKCGFELLKVSNKNENPFRFYHLAEKLVLEELDDNRLFLQCEGPKCFTRHKEWMKIHQAVALNAIKKWRRWLVIQKPFDQSGNLTPYWADRVKHLRGSIADVRWEQWTQPSRLDYYIFISRPHIAHCTSLLKKHFAHDRKDFCFWFVGSFVTFLSLEVHGAEGAFWTGIILLFL